MPIAPDVYKKIVGAKVYIDENFQEPIDLPRLPGRPVSRGIIFIGFSPAFIKGRPINT